MRVVLNIQENETNEQFIERVNNEHRRLKMRFKTKVVSCSKLSNVVYNRTGITGAVIKLNSESINDQNFQILK